MKVFGVTKKELFLILAGSTLLALAINWFLSPNALITGGISGTSIIVEEVTKGMFGVGVPLWITNLGLNIPLFLISIRQRGFQFAQKSLYSVLWVSFALWFTKFLPNPFTSTEDLLLPALFGGIFLGCGIGLVIRAGGTTGGTDMLASIIKFKHNNFPITKLMLMIDGCIILSGFFIFGQEKAMYGIISLVVINKIISNIIEGIDYAKAVFIISDENERISKEIMEKIPRGVTGLKATGKYSREDKEMLYVVVSQNEIARLRDLVQEIDPKAFMTIADVREVLGEGFVKDPTALTN
ncbi:YitT family protein [Niameybacter massiliensis]|uniref:YitT family protein n=1 Tax=Holtiella tumoricola TaxID=3018743 RepID=A0AA42DKG8_9FIRM|nr:YitT family protein [Holtiella tumoricola]MDA3730664.1 YitT family protein [Holtiella tumoricola]